MIKKLLLTIAAAAAAVALTATPAHAVGEVHVKIVELGRTDIIYAQNGGAAIADTAEKCHVDRGDLTRPLRADGLVGCMATPAVTIWLSTTPYNIII